MPSKSKGSSGPSLFCEWVVSTTIPAALGPGPKPKPKPKLGRRDVVKFEVTTDDESEMDTVSITYPRTGRNPSPPSNSSAEVVAKKVRFEENVKSAPIKSALKKTRVTFSELEETSDSEIDAGLESTESGKTSDSDSGSTDDSVKAAKGKKQHKKKKAASGTDTDTDSEDDSEIPHPTCKCASCTWGRRPMSKHCLKTARRGSDSSVETSDSDTDTSTSKSKKKNKKNGGKHTPVSDSETDLSKSEIQTSESEPAKPAKKQNSPKRKGVKKWEPKSEESETASESSESEPETSPKVRDKKSAQKNNTNKDKCDETKKNNQKQGQKPSQKQTKKQRKESEDDADDESEEATEESSKKKSQSKKESKVQNGPKRKQKEGKRRKSQSEALPVPNTRRPNLIQPVRAEVVQTERVIETPYDPPPNAYYDPSHNVVRVYYGPAYGGHHGHALYPSRLPETKPLPLGTPHPTQNPYLYGFNHQEIPPPQGYGYSNVPVTQGMPVGAWNSMVPQLGIPPVQPIPGLDNQRPKQDGNFAMSGALNVPPSTKDKGKDGENNVGPDNVKGSKNPYYNPAKSRSQFSSYGSGRRQENHRELGNSARDDHQPGSNQEWPTNDAAGDQQGTWETRNDKPDEWQDWGSNQKDKTDSWKEGSNQGSYRSNETQRKPRNHWGSDTYLGGRCNENEWGNSQQEKPQSDNNVGGWDNDSKDKESNTPRSNVMPGTWVDSAPAVAATDAAPAWGDLSAAQDTGGQHENW